MGKRQAQELLSERVNLPSLPDVVTRLNALVDDPKVGLRQIGELISRDGALTAKILRIANSAYYGLKEPVLSPEAAATVLGARSLRNIALQASVFKHYEHLSQVQDFDLEGVWRHGVLTGHLSQAMAKKTRKPLGISAEEFYTCGLLHDLGKVIMLENLREEYIHVFREARRVREAVHNVEEHLLGYTHIDVGALLAAKWRLPEVVARAIEYHHGPKYEVMDNPAVAVVALADQVAYRLETSEFEASLPRLSELAWECLEIGPEAFREAIEYARDVRDLIEV